MARINRLRNICAGLLSSFMSRNNRVEDWWAPGLLYNEAARNAMRLDLLGREASPPGPAAATVARNYGEMLQRALLRDGVDAAELVEAAVELRFNAPVRPMYYQTTGDPFDCTITLRTRGGKVVTRQAHERCRRQAPQRYSHEGG